MIRKILRGYAKSFAGAGKVLLLFAVCGAAALVIIFPLWQFAVAAPEAYTFFVLFFAAAFAAVFAVLKIRSFLGAAGEDAAEKKNRIRRLWTAAAKITVAAGGIALFIAAVYAGHTPAGIGILIAAFILYGIIAFGTGKNEGTHN